MNHTLAELQQEIAHSLQGLDTSQVQLLPPVPPGKPQKWSIQQITEHLLLTYAETEAALNARIAKGSPTRTQPKFWQHLMQYTVCRIGFFPSGRKAPALVAPPATATPLSGDQLARAAADHLARLDRSCEQAAALFGHTSRCATHMVLGPLSVDQWRSFQLVHGRHHLKQIAAIRSAHQV
ncbi:MAG: DUF1569 domain-containing protein [Acidobacteriota bacterium]|nr:DUF1569 domain-containing protein [Acidobacteriota bacterium]